MNKKTISEIRRVFTRIKSESNSERYNLSNTHVLNDEERLWELCKKFWSEDRCTTPLDENYKPNSELDDLTARRYIIELEELLDKLGWE